MDDPFSSIASAAATLAVFSILLLPLPDIKHKPFPLAGGRYVPGPLHQGRMDAKKPLETFFSPNPVSKGFEMVEAEGLEPTTR